MLVMVHAQVHACGRGPAPTYRDPVDAPDAACCCSVGSKSTSKFQIQKQVEPLKNIVSSSFTWPGSVHFEFPSLSPILTHSGISEIRIHLVQPVESFV